MKYIKINPQDLRLEILQVKPKTGFVIPNQLLQSRILSPIEKVIYQEILYKACYEEDKRKGIKNRSYKLVYPDPWLVAVGYIIWEGILQGLTWDSIKLIVKSAMEKLCNKKLAPCSPSSGKTIKVITRIRNTAEVGFNFTKYGTDGKKLYHMFMGLRRVQSKLIEKEINIISNSQVEDALKKKTR